MRIYPPVAGAVHLDATTCVEVSHTIWVCYALTFNDKQTCIGSVNR